MISFGHTSIGVIVGITTYHYLGNNNLEIGLIAAGVAGIASHYITDAIPHGHFNLGKNYAKGVLPVIIFDLGLSIILFLSLIFLKQNFSKEFFYILFGIGGAQLPDVLDGLIYAKIIKPARVLKIENKFHQNLHWHGKGNKILLLSLLDIWQLGVVLYALYLVVFKI